MPSAVLYQHIMQTVEVASLQTNLSAELNSEDHT